MYALNFNGCYQIAFQNVVTILISTTKYKRAFSPVVSFIPFYNCKYYGVLQYLLL